MKLVENGPDIPSEVLQAQEDGNLILFCGAGVSYRAGLGDFKWLVDRVYEKTNLTPTEIEGEEYEAKQYDRVLTLLEHGDRLGPTRMRKAVVKSLQLELDADLSTHRALFELATTSDGTIRLVTTNFDRGFADGSPILFKPYKAAALPSPAKSRWNAVVHLHGLIDYNDDSCLPDLVLTSGDFGRAYLVERWASTFVTEMFRQFTVLFVGYSVNDPVVRYIVDAFAADRRAGDQARQPYVFVGNSDNSDKPTENKWKARGITPILYDSHDDHRLLHDSLREWADLVRDGFFSGRVSMIRRYAAIKPQVPYEHDYRVSQMLWALSDPTGDAAWQFASLKEPEDESPPVEWLPILEQNGYLPFPPTQDGPALAGWDYPAGIAPPLHPVTRHLSIWIVKHMKEPLIQEWLLTHKGLLHPQFRTIVHTHLTLGRDHDLDEAQRRLWLLASSDSFSSPSRRPDTTYLLSDNWDLEKKHALLDALQPTVALKKPFHFYPLEGAPRRVADLSHVEVGVAFADQVKFIVEELSKKQGWDEALCGMAFAYTNLLIDTMELLEWVGEAERLSDLSHHEIPSIEHHPQNRSWGGWYLIVELVRDSWVATANRESATARDLAGIWARAPYPVFRRLEAFARKRLDVYRAADVVNFFLTDNGWWLWSIETRREYIQLLKATWPRLEPDERNSLTTRILSGPPREMFRSDLTKEDWTRLRDNMIWLRLAKLEATGTSLPDPAQDELNRLMTAYEWELAEDERDEFSGWITVGREAESIRDDMRPPSRERLAQLLRSEQQERGESPWLQAVHSVPRRALLALYEVCKEPGVEITASLALLLDRYRPQGSYERILRLTNAVLEESDPVATLHPAAMFLRDMADRLPESSEPPFWEMWDRLAETASQPDSKDVDETGDPVNDALSSPSGRLTDALFERLGKLTIQAGDGIPTAYACRLEGLLREPQAAGAATMISSRLGYLWAVDPGWPRVQILPMLSTVDDSFDTAAWAGYVYNARLDPELLESLKGGLITACGNRQQLGRWCDNACALFAAAAIQLPDLFSADDTISALQTMDGEGRQAVAVQLRQQLEHADEKAGSLWQYRIGPWVRSWPQAGKLTNPGVSRELALAAVRAGDEFKDAVETVTIFLRNEPDEGHGNNWVRFALAKTDHPEKLPWATLNLLAASVSYEDKWPGSKFREVLDRMANADLSIAKDPRYQRLSEYLDRNGE